MPKPSKYRSVRTEVGGISFASKKEARRWSELLLLVRSGHISDLRRQVRFDLDVNGIPVAKYIADHVYREKGKNIVEDVKGVLTPVYKIKRALMLACHGIKIREV